MLGTRDPQCCETDCDNGGFVLFSIEGNLQIWRRKTKQTEQNRQKEKKGKKMAGYWGCHWYAADFSFFLLFKQKNWIPLQFPDPIKTVSNPEINICVRWARGQDSKPASGYRIYIHFTPDNKMVSVNRKPLTKSRQCNVNDWLLWVPVV